MWGLIKLLNLVFGSKVYKWMVVVYLKIGFIKKKMFVFWYKSILLNIVMIEEI